MRDGDMTEPQAHFNLETGEVTHDEPVEDAGDGWTRCWMATNAVEMTLWRRVWWGIKRMFRGER